MHSLFLKILVVASVLPVLSACSAISYYGQAVRGHLDLSSRREPIAELLSDERTPAELRQRLETVQDIRRFAIEELKLPDNGSYLSYADLQRNAVTWLVSAAPELSLEPKRWCYLFVGCLSYRGYFNQQSAIEHAAELAAQGYETAVTPSPAYSTLGRFADPVVNTMLAFDDLQLAGLLFHELAHQVIYLKHDAEFSESFASTVERIGRQRWAEQRGIDGTNASIAQQREESLIARLLQSRADLSQIYASDADDGSKRREKRQVLNRLRDDYHRLRADWGDYRGFDHWFADGGPNNARLALLSTYQLNVPAFEALLQQHDGDWDRFYRAVRDLAGLRPEERKQHLQQLCAGADL